MMETSADTEKPTNLLRVHSVTYVPRHHNGGAGGNRTPVHQTLTIRDTTIPNFVANAATSVGRLVTAEAVTRGLSFQTVSILSCCQRSFLPSFSASVAGLR